MGTGGSRGSSNRIHHRDVVKPNPNSGRRTFLGAALVASGAAVGGVIRAMTSPRTPAREDRPPVAPGQYEYDVSEFERTDPRHILFQPARSFDTGMRQVKRIETGPDDAVYVAGDKAVRVFEPDGRRRREIGLDRSPTGLHVDSQGTLWVSLGRYFEVYEPDGTRRMRSSVLGESAFVTALAVRNDEVFLADAGGREVLVCAARDGAIRRRFGKREAGPQVNGANPGFIVPSPYFDLGFGPDGHLHIANPGRLRVEAYTVDGGFISSWGQAGMKIDRFCGCCNPAYLCVRRNGEFLTSEKGLARINVYSAAGVFVGAVAGPDTLVEDKELARRACEDCTVGAGFDIAETRDGHVLALDPYRKTVRRFEPVSRA